MCGIFGIALDSEAALGALLRKALERLEYRGYDSAGIAVVSPGGIVVKKDAGKVAEVSKRLGFDSVRGATGVAHTRWATHGRPSRRNAHPHTDCRGLIAVVHNGIIENYEELKAELAAKGHVFASETDTEVFAHLIEEYEKQGLAPWEAFKRALSRIRGAYALAVVNAREPDKVFFARNLSPLIVGIGDGYNLIASDIPTVLDHTNKVLPLRDGEYGYITPHGIYVEYDGVGVAYGDRVQLVPWSAEQALRGGYPHFMLKEIHEQPEALSSTVAGLEPRKLAEAAEALINAERIYIVGAGTSYYAGLVLHLGLASYKMLAFPIISSEYAAYEDAFDVNDVTIAVSQSGETIDTIKAVRVMREKGARVIAVTNVVASTLARESDLVLYTRAGPEIGVAATKTFTTQVALLTALHAAVGRELGFDVSAEESNLKRLPEAARKALELNEGTAKAAAEHVAKRSSSYYLSRGLGMPVAMEGALKLKEIAYIHAEAYPAGESKHGPIALVEEKFPVVFVFSDPSVRDKLLNNVAEMQARDALLIGVAPRGDDVVKRFKYAFEVPHMDPMTNAAAFVIPLQLLAYYTAIKLGRDPDKPRNLAKTVTVE
ncbi:MAG: glutamine--fructose-6-phosphate transaminase (isomerizing) [Thermoproteus sp.]|nr:glutamine--fructose-6-phosphate transaminase (isomerizing) [Thermoproteus sp.]